MALPSFHSMLIGLEQNLPELWRFVTGATYLAGIFFAVRSLFLFKEYGEGFASQKSPDIRKPLVCLLTATVLLYWPDIYHSLMETVYRTSTVTPYSYQKESDYTDLIKVCGHVIQFIGFIAFIRGWMLLANIYQEGSRGGGLSKAMAHIIGGLLAINIFGTWLIVESSL
ncbi:MAG: hypothetical protein KKH06_01595, partial [Gammaproteobacteria bacterium]|nr:hypothetical protein [Gammaproteobacteria bacterium]